MAIARPVHIILLHGLGANGDDLAPIGRMLAEYQAGNQKWSSESFTVHAPDAPVAPVTVNNGYRMPSWFDIYGLDRDAPVDVDGVDASVERIVALIESDVGDDPFVLAGFSQGGVIALRAACASRRSPIAVLLLSTWLPAADRFVLPDDRKEMPIFIGHGEQDDVVPFASAARMGQVLSAAGAMRVETRFYTMAHQICPEEMNDMAQFLAGAVRHPK
jgi:predicted esterase